LSLKREHVDMAKNNAYTALSAPMSHRHSGCPAERACTRLGSDFRHDSGTLARGISRVCDEARSHRACRRNRMSVV